jgi:hypothetical protein
LEVLAGKVRARSSKARPRLEALEERIVLSNDIVNENALAGSPPSEWDIIGSGSDTIQGFTTSISVNKGDTVYFKINTPSTHYRLDIYRVGYYQGNGARKVASLDEVLSAPQVQPGPLTDPATGLNDFGNWNVSASWAVPTTAVSGIYFAKLVREDGVTGSSHVFFVVRNDASTSDLLYQTSDTTWEAYNTYGGDSLYSGNGSVGRAYKVSYNRPFTDRGISGGLGTFDWVFHAEYPMVRWLEANGYDVTYFTHVDTAARGAEIKNHKAFLSVGHDEYWANDERSSVEAARDAGVNLAFFSGDTSFWKTRWEPSIDGSGTPFRTLVCYKLYSPGDSNTQAAKSSRRIAQSENSLDSTRPLEVTLISSRRMSRCRAFRLSACDGRRSFVSHGQRLRSTNSSSSRARAHTSTTLYNTKLTVNAPRLAYTFRTCC